jgi:putative transposase
MARLPRYVLPGQPQHVIQRGNNRGVTFFADEDYSFYLDRLKEACTKHGCAVHAYVLMTNHVHLLLTPDTSSSIAKVMQSVGRRYVQHINYTYRRTGTLWEGRYKATLIDSEQYLLTCSRYIELNPVRAGIVDQSSLTLLGCNEYHKISTSHLVTVAVAWAHWLPRAWSKALYSSAFHMS